MRYRIVTAESIGGWVGYQVQELVTRPLFGTSWRNRNRDLTRTLAEAKAILARIKMSPVGVVVHEED